MVVIGARAADNHAEMAKILVVDDQRNMRTTLAMLLRSADHTVEEAENGQWSLGFVLDASMIEVERTCTWRPTEGPQNEGSRSSDSDVDSISTKVSAEGELHTGPVPRVPMGHFYLSSRRAKL